MAYKFQLGAARLSGSVVQEGAITAQSSALSGSSLNIGSANLSAAELEVLDDVSAGTAAADKALVLDSSRDIANINRLTAAELGAFQAQGAIDFNNQAMTNVDINSGTIDGATIATSDITVGAGKSLDVSAGTLTLTAGQVGADKVGAGTFDAGAYSFAGSTIAAANHISSSVLDFQSALKLNGQTAIDSSGNYFGNNASLNEISASGDVFLDGSTLRIPDVAAVPFASADSMLLRDADDDKMKRITLANYASAIAGDGLAVSSGVLAVGVDNSSIEISGDALQVAASGITNDMLAGSIANAKLANYSVSYGGVSLDLGGSDATPAFDLSDATSYPGDSSLVTVGALDAGSITSGFGSIDNGDSAITTTGTGSFGKVIVSGDLVVQGSTTTIDSATILVTGSISFEGSSGDDYETTLGVVDPTADRSILLPNINGNLAAFSDSSFQSAASAITLAELNILDGGSSNSSVTIEDADQLIVNDNGTMVQTAMSDLKAYIEDGFTPALNVALKADGDALAAGINYFADMSSDGEDSVTLPASPSVGQSVKVKAPSDCSADRYITINRAGSQTIDGETSIRLESPFAAVELVYVASDLWRVF